MPHRFILTIDVGTSSTKTALWDDAGAVRRRGLASVPARSPRPDLGGDRRPRMVGRGLRHHAAGRRTGPHRSAGRRRHRGGWDRLDAAAGRSRRRAAVAGDDLARPPGGGRGAGAGERPGRRSAWLRWPPTRSIAAYITPKLLWLKATPAGDFRRGALLPDLLGLYRLAADRRVHLRLHPGLRLSLLRHRAGAWCETPPPRWACRWRRCRASLRLIDIAGELTPAAAADLGLPAGTPVIAGCLDAAAGALGAGVTRLGQTNEQGGQAGGMAISLDRVVVEPRLIFSHHVLPGQYLLQGGTVGGGSLGWFRDVLGLADGADSQAVFEPFSAQAAGSSPGAGGVIFMPYMAGERTPLWNSSARGVFLGLSYTTSRGDMLRAMMEGCAFAVYHNMQVASPSMAPRCPNTWARAGPRAATCGARSRRTCTAGRSAGAPRRRRRGRPRAGPVCADHAGCRPVRRRRGVVERLLPERRVFEPSPSRHALYRETVRGLPERVAEAAGGHARNSRRFGDGGDA